MPFPGSQTSNTIEIAYWLNQYIFWLRILLLGTALSILLTSFSAFKLIPKIIFTLLFILYAVVFYFVNVQFLADKMFYQPKIIQFAQAEKNRISLHKLVLGVVVNGEAKAYPIQLIGYHHQVRDDVGGTPIMVTYCTVCRTGRIYQPIVNGQHEKFRLVGMDHFNALFEDSSTKSWWRQASGEAIIGPLKGSKLLEIPSRQMTLESWLNLYPDSKILQPDQNFQKEYTHLEGYDSGTLSSALERRDSTSWKAKSFVIGFVFNDTSVAYDWNLLTEKRIIQDSIAGFSILLTLESNKSSFHSFNRILNGVLYHFEPAKDKNHLTDLNTGSSWSFQGVCYEGVLKGARLKTIQSYQEFWHSWQTFHPETIRRFMDK